MDALCRRVLAFVRAHSLFGPGERVVLGFSGGPDSVALTLLLTDLRRAGDLPLTVHLAHLNHALRGSESDREEEFCRAFARRHGLEITVRRHDVAAEACAGSLEAAARTVRYAFLGEVARKTGARTVATGHHADDVAETVLLRLIRGAGVAGLGAVAPYRALDSQDPPIRLVRPLLAVRKAELLDMLNARGEPFCTDSSNADTGYTRNRVRHRLLPLLEAEFPTFSVASLCALNESAVEAGQCFGALLDDLWGDLCRRSAKGEVVLDAAVLAQAPAPLRKAAAARALAALAPQSPPALRAEHYQALSCLADREPGVEVTLPRGFFARREHGVIYIGRRHGQEPLPERRLTVPGSVSVPEAGLLIQAESVAADPDTAGSGTSVQLSLREPDLPLRVRGRRAGDRFRPLGMPEPVRLKKFLIGRRMPRHSRDRTPLVVTRQGEIAWVVGCEIGDCFKLTGGEDRVVSLRAEPLDEPRD